MTLMAFLISKNNCQAYIYIFLKIDDSKMSLIINGKSFIPQLVILSAIKCHSLYVVFYCTSDGVLPGPE